MVAEQTKSIYEYIHKASAIAGADATGWSFSHLKALCDSDHADVVPEMIGTLMRSETPASVAPYLLGGKCVPLCKPKKGAIRPLGVGNVFLRLEQEL